MKTRIIFLLLYFPASWTFAQEKLYTDSDTSISASVGETFSIKVASNRTTGYSWSVGEISNAAQVVILGSEYLVAEPGGVGKGGEEIWKFKAMGKGTVKLTWSYARPWENEPPARTIIFTVTVE